MRRRVRLYYSIRAHGDRALCSLRFCPQQAMVMTLLFLVIGTGTVACSSRQAAPESASQTTGSTRRSRVSPTLNGAATHTLRHWKQSIVRRAVRRPDETGRARPDPLVVLLGEEVRDAPGGQGGEHEPMGLHPRLPRSAP